MMRVLTSWLEDGGQVVAAELAQKRGEVCAKCPLNVAGLWWEKYSKEPIAATIKLWLERKNEMQLGVPSEENLFMCKACGCCVRLKIWEPLKYITAHTEQSVMDKYDSNCWIKTESKIP
jgi:hypothetical protein